MPETQRDSGSDPQENSPGKSAQSGWLKKLMGEAADPTQTPVISNEEVYALLQYTASHGIEAEKVKALSRAIHEPEPDPTEVAALFVGRKTLAEPQYRQ